MQKSEEPRKTTYVQQIFRGNKSTWDLYQSIQTSPKIYDTCARQSNLNEEQKQSSFYMCSMALGICFSLITSKIEWSLKNGRLHAQW